MASAYLTHVYGDAALTGDASIQQALAHFHPEGLPRTGVIGTDLTASSSLTGLFDAVATLLGLEHDVSPDDWFEGRGVAQLEAVAATGLKPYSVPVSMRPAETLDVDPLIRAIVSDIAHGVPVSEIAGRFHSTIAQMLATSARQVGKTVGLKTVVLSGDAFQNQLLLEDLIKRLEALDFEVLINRQVPPNDEGISLGQAAVAAAWLQHHPDDERVAE